MEITVREELKEYLHSEILPQYDRLDKAHGRSHVLFVAQKGTELARYYGANQEIIYTAALFHDIGMQVDRKRHADISAQRMRADHRIQDFFGKDDIEIMAEAIEDHSSSGGREPRSIYGKILYQADRDLRIEVIVGRAMEYGMKNYPGQSFEWHYRRVSKYLNEKYGDGGRLVLWLPDKKEEEKFRNVKNAIRRKWKIYFLCRCFYQKIILKSNLVERG